MSSDCPQLRTFARIHQIEYHMHYFDVGMHKLLSWFEERSDCVLIYVWMTRANRFCSFVGRKRQLFSYFFYFLYIIIFDLFLFLLLVIRILIEMQ
jgi:hypothetical protein